MPEIYVHASIGRSVEQKRAFVKAVTAAAVAHFNAAADDVLISIIEDKPENVAKGGILDWRSPIAFLE